MSSSQNSPYSQAFNFGSFIQDKVDPRTGQYTCTIEIYKAPTQTRNCPPLQLSLSYNPMNSQDIGFGQGWALNLSSYQHRQSKTLLLSTGEQFRITETASALTVDDQKLKSFQFKKKDSNFQIVHKDGQIEILSNANDTYSATVPVELYAANGRSLKLSWIVSGDQPRLRKVEDGSEVSLEIGYTDSQTEIIRAPSSNGSSTLSLVQRNNRLVKLQLPLEEKPSWNFAYETFDQTTCLTSVTSPSGLMEQVQYKAKGHRLPKGAPYETIPYVISHTVRPGCSQPPIRTKYSYSDQNFLAYGAGFDWKAGEDNLYRAQDEYRYSATVQVEDGPQTRRIYNRFHLLVSIHQQHGTKQVNRDFTFYALKNTSFQDQPAQYQLPKSIQTTYKDTVNLASRTETNQHTFDEWGNPTQKIDASGVKVDRVYYPAVGEQDSRTGEVLCPADPHGF
ncbi:hypothetical protein MMC14_007209 [Varicellaria rhodocarpa]|nr:hypothetical protein [Varicellaria rhodocarpa]